MDGRWKMEGSTLFWPSSSIFDSLASPNKEDNPLLNIAKKWENALPNMESHGSWFLVA
jgi:hypothetical protein